MALLNNLYVFVENEEISYDVELSTHPVEQGEAVSDHIKNNGYTISLSGKITDYNIRSVLGNSVNVGSEVMPASRALQLIKEMQTKGTLINYIGRNTASNMQIESLSTSHPNTVWGGCEFSMTLKKVRIAKPAYTATAATANGGTQQVDTGDNSAVYHTVKKGDCVWNLVTNQYKSLEPKFSKVMDKCDWVMEQNPHAFSRKGDFGTLQIGKKILMGYRKSGTNQNNKDSDKVSAFQRLINR